MKNALAVLASIALVGSLTACGGNRQAENTTPAQPQQAAAPSQAPAASGNSKVPVVNVAETEMTIKLSQTTVPQGPVEFVVRNEGRVPHEMVLLRTDLPLNQLPTRDGKFDESSKSVKKITEVETEDLKPGQNKSTRVTLSKGRYVVVCNVGNHFQEGMKAELTVQ